MKFRQLQAEYQPEVGPLFNQLFVTDADPDAIHNTPLRLPSSLPPELLRKCSMQLISMEKELQIGQC